LQQLADFSCLAGVPRRHHQNRQLSHRFVFSLSQGVIAPATDLRMPEVVS
jgi:hypothetical protein